MSKVWFITGAGRGLGVDIAKAALAAGHAVVATGRDPVKITAAIGAHDNLLSVKLDVQREGLQEGQGTQTPISGVGERAYFLYPKPDNEYQGNVAFLVAKSGNHTLALSLDVPKGSSADSMRPPLESLMKTVLARLP